MRIYADTSALIAWFHPADPFAETVTTWCRDKEPDFIWNVFIRAELRHNLRRLPGNYAAIAWHAYRSSETSKRLRLTTHSLGEMLQWGDEISARHAASFAVGTWDCVHVGIAQHLRAEVFITCDAAQAELAKQCHLPDVHLFK